MKEIVCNLILVGEEWSASVSGRIVPRKVTPVSIGLEVRCASMTAWTFFEKEELLPGR